MATTRSLLPRPPARRRRFVRASPAAVAGAAVLSMSDGVVVFDDDGRVVLWNPAAAALTGWSRDEVETRARQTPDGGLFETANGRWLKTEHLNLSLGGEPYTALIFSERAAELERTQAEVLERLAQAAELRDDETGEHTRRVGRLAAALARELGLPACEVDAIRRAAPLHDVGKIGVADAILLKPGALTDDERAAMKRHTEIGERLMSAPGFPLLRTAQEIALNHHERWDGAGYPRGLAGEGIPLPGRVVAVADVYDALTHDRPYKSAWSPRKAIAEIRAQAGRQFDPAVSRAMVTLYERAAPETY